MIAAGRRAAQRGFSLLELAVALVVMGALGVAFWQFLPSIRSLPAIARLNAPTLVRAEDALNGFLLANSRLPCPDVDGSGVENCAAADGTLHLLGWLPVKTLGLSLSERVRYGVYRAPATGSASVASDGDLAALKDRYQPLLPPGVTSTQSNGLDFCVALRNLVVTPGTLLQADLVQGGSTRSMPIAYGLAVAGALDADRDGSPFDGANVSPGKFAAGGTPHSATYDDETRTVGIPELFTRIGCATRLAEANSAARAAYAAYDADQFAQRYVDFRSFAIQVRRMNVTLADVDIILASFDQAIAIGTSWSAIALASESGGVGAAVTVPAGVAVVAAAAALAGAIANKVIAENAYTFATAQLPPATAFKAATAGDLLLAGGRAKSLDEKGLLP